jgi:type I site-specific restriction endonuclease
VELTISPVHSFEDRSLVGLDREAAKQAIAGFVSGKTLGANQIEFVSLIVEHLTEHGAMKPELLYESPFTDGPASIKRTEKREDLVSC